MKKTILTLCIGMFIGLMVGSISGTFAAIGDRVEAIVAEFNIVVDGEVQVLETTPVVINDSTYVPLRAMANMLGKDVTYKSDSRTIELNTPTEQNKKVVDTSMDHMTIERLERSIATQNKILDDIIPKLEELREEGIEGAIPLYEKAIEGTKKLIAKLEAELAKRLTQ